jgi:ABC-2 type transport system ATP-binding protein
VWAEVRYLNRELGMTVFLTTQYLDEADALADRIGVVVAGRLVAEGSPSALKRQVGDDVITVELDGHDRSLVERLAAIGGVREVAADHGTITVKTVDASCSLLPVASELATADVRVRSLNLRSPTLGDVYEQLVGTTSTPNAVSA